MKMQNRTWKVGELSKLTGLTIRTLHHYDEIGLLRPKFRTDTGHHLYAEDDADSKRISYTLSNVCQLLNKH